MTRESIKQEIKAATQSLLKMAREMSYNNISDNVGYIIRKVDKRYALVSTAFERSVLRRKINSLKPILPLEVATKELKNYFDDLYEINLYVYKAEKEKTIIEIEITEKDSDLNIRDGAPFLYCKVYIPPYANDTKEKFDINWQLGTWSSKWKMFWWRKKIKPRLHS